MAAARPEETDLLRRLYAAATADGDGFSDLLNLLAGSTRADAAVLVQAPVRGRRWLDISHGVEIAALAPALADAEDPWGLDRMRPERIYSAEDLPGLATRHDGLRLRAMRVRLGSDGASAWLIVLRRGEDFRAIDGVTLGALAPHLPLALDAARRWAAERARAALHRVQAARLGAGWVAFDADGKVLEHNDAAAALLDGVASQVQPGLRLAISASDTEARVAAALRKATAPEAAPQALMLSSAPLLSLVLCPAQGPGLPEGAAVIGHLRAALHGHLGTLRAAQMFGLTRAEARLALALAQGHSLAEAATALGLTVETARSYSRNIFARTGLRGQPDLMRALLSSALWLAPEVDV